MTDTDVLPVLPGSQATTGGVGTGPYFLAGCVGVVLALLLLVIAWSPNGSTDQGAEVAGSVIVDGRAFLPGGPVPLDVVNDHGTLIGPVPPGQHGLTGDVYRLSANGQRIAVGSAASGYTFMFPVASPGDTGASVFDLGSVAAVTVTEADSSRSLTTIELEAFKTGLSEANIQEAAPAGETRKVDVSIIYSDGLVRPAVLFPEFNHLSGFSLNERATQALLP